MTWIRQKDAKPRPYSIKTLEDLCFDESLLQPAVVGVRMVSRVEMFHIKNSNQMPPTRDISVRKSYPTVTDQVSTRSFKLSKCVVLIEPIKRGKNGPSHVHMKACRNPFNIQTSS